jgi:hypothetical protein
LGYARAGSNPVSVVGITPLLKFTLQWCSGNMVAFQAIAPGSIPGWSIDTVAEWLRRTTRNRLGSSRAGSNPVSVVRRGGRVVKAIDC